MGYSIHTEEKYRLQSLLHNDKKGKRRGAMSPVLFSNEIAKQIDLRVDELVRVWFDDKDLARHSDVLVMVQRHKNANTYAMVIDMGDVGMPVAVGFSNDPDVVLTATYNDSTLTRKLTVQEIAKIFADIEKMFPSDDNYWILKGMYFGFPGCCIKSFCDAPGIYTVEQERVHHGHGFIPCHTHALEILAGNVTLEGLIHNRICKEAFPNGDGR